MPAAKLPMVRWRCFLIVLPLLLCSLAGCADRVDSSGDGGPNPTQVASPVAHASTALAKPEREQSTQARLLIDGGWQTSDGEERFFSDPSVRAVTVIFVLPDCPISNSYAPEYSRLHAEFASQGLPIVLVHVDPELTAEEISQHARDYQLRLPVIFDPQHNWARRAGATKVPEVAVFSRDKELLYRGRIDDRYLKLGRQRPTATTHELRDALTAILQGRPIATTRTETVGCWIPLLETEPPRSAEPNTTD